MKDQVRIIYETADEVLKGLDILWEIRIFKFDGLPEFRLWARNTDVGQGAEKLKVWNTTWSVNKIEMLSANSARRDIELFAARIREDLRG